MVDEIRTVCEEAGGALTWLHDELGSTEAFEWDGKEGLLQVTIDPVFGSTYVLQVAEGGEIVTGSLSAGEIVTGDVEGVDHLRRLITWLEEGGLVPES